MKLYSYIITRDFGFAPNPFHGYCTLATCKPRIRCTASIGDVIVGVGSGAKNSTLKNKLVYAMIVQEKMTYDEYWADNRFHCKKPIMSGSLLQMYGDNIYHTDSKLGVIVQENSHHSYDEGKTNYKNYNRDVPGQYVLISQEYWYWGGVGIDIPNKFLCLANVARNHIVIKDENLIADFLLWLRSLEGSGINSYEDRSFPLMCNFPSIRYNDNILDILELALLETIRFYYSDALFAAHKHCGNIPDDAITFNRVPDSFAVKRANSNTIVYPEPELYHDEVELLSNGKKLITPLSYHSSALVEVKIGLSISEISDDELIILGQEKSHLKKLSQMLAQKMIRNGAQLIYGGDLRNNGFTEFLFEEAAIIQDKIQSSDILIKNYTMWPIHLLQKEKFKSWSAKYKGICKFEKMSPAPDVENELDSTKPITRDTAQNRYIWSRCLTYMREEMITECDFRISAGGKITQYTGCMPGILEEIYIAITRNKPLYLLGGFGGVTSKLCHYLQTGVILEELSVDWQKTNNEHYSELLLEYTKHNKKIDYSWFSKLTINSLNNGLSEDDNLRLFNTPFVDEAIHLITKGVKNLRSF